MKLLFIAILTGLVIACGNGAKPKTAEYTHTASPHQIEIAAKKGIRGEIRSVQSATFYNPEAVIPPQCYTKHNSHFNTCMTCHQSYPFMSRPNAMNEAALQMEYAFSNKGLTNHWLNLFEDRRERINSISDCEIIRYINIDNYSTLIDQLESMADWQGPIPKINNLYQGAGAFDELGFAKDQSHWVAFNYKPFPGTFWPTNGATDDVMIRLPKEFRTPNCKNQDYSQDVYLANLAILEMAIKGLNKITTPPINEKYICQDINNNGAIEDNIQLITQQTHYVGLANNIAVTPMLYPQDTEFLHTLRYVGISNSGEIIIPPRMKEVRYMRKNTFLSPASLMSAYGNEQQEKTEGRLPNFNFRQDRGISNTFGWTLLGFIEAKDGHLRSQTNEETLYCMGCHSTIGTTIDQTFAFSRKVTGAKGWGYINLHGMQDVPNINTKTPEILNYLATAGGGDEFRQNTELQQKWFNQDGSLKRNEIINSDVYTLITPSTQRALALNKAYLTIVLDQDYIYGRDPNLTPATNIHRQIDATTPVLNADKVQPWDIRLNWDSR